MKFIAILSFTLVAASLLATGEAEQQTILRRVAKSLPSNTNLGPRTRQVTVRSVDKNTAGPSEASLAGFGQRSSNESGSTKTKPEVSNTPASNNVSPATTSSPTQTPTTPAPSATQPKISERQQAAPVEVEALSSAPSSWQVLTAVEAPAATRTATSDLASSSSEDSSSSLAENDFLRSPSGTKGGLSSTGETFSRLRQQTSKSRQQQPPFYPQQQQSQGKTSNYQATKTNWYKPSTTARPAPIVQQYEQQSEQYVEQQQVESAPPGQAEPFAFDFNTQDNSGNGQYRKEESDNNGVVRGSYGFRDASGMYRHVEYVADQNGFRANIKSNEPGVEAGPKSQPADIRLDGGAAPAQSQRFTNNDNNNADWTATSSSSEERADLALAPPDFESSHKAERIRRAPTNFRI